MKGDPQPGFNFFDFSEAVAAKPGLEHRLIAADSFPNICPLD
jgi:hypothetical protein